MEAMEKNSRAISSLCRHQMNKNVGQMVGLVIITGVSDGGGGGGEWTLLYLPGTVTGDTGSVRSSIVDDPRFAGYRFRLSVISETNHLLIKIPLKGDYIHIVIKTKDKYGNYRDKGGDMFQGVMLNAQLQKSTAGRVYDYGNGTYSIYFYAAWAGDANISIYMVYTREMILMFNNNRLRKEYLQWTGVYGEDPNSEEVTCKLIREGVWEDKCSYGNRNSFGNIVFVCDKPKTFSCKDIMSVTSFTGKTVNGADAKKERLLLSYLFNNQQNTLLTTMPMRIAVKDTSANVPTLPMCGPDLPIPVTDGYWTDDSTYVSLVCRSQKWTQAQAHKCLANVSLALYGDSTLGQFGQSLRFRYNYSNFIVVSKGFFPHGPTFWTIGYESEFLDGINKTLCDSKQIVFVMNIIFHYTEWSFMLYIERLFATKLAVERLFMRCPTAKVFFKVSHPRSVLGGTQSRFDVVWVAFDMDRMIRRVFGGMGVHFLGVWDMSISHFSSLQVHLAPELIDQQINLLLSYICPDLVD
ncbi:NXPE family member 3-like [Saccoglossus kowalevskii]